jgi:hypothetical protein
MPDLSHNLANVNTSSWSQHAFRHALIQPARSARYPVGLVELVSHEAGVGDRNVTKHKPAVERVWRANPAPSSPVTLPLPLILLYRLRKESSGFGSPFDISGRTGLSARAEVSKQEHVAESG